MKEILLTTSAISIILFSCWSEHDNEANPEAVDSIAHVSDSAGTIPLPSGFSLDTVRPHDSLLNLTVFIELPVSGNAVHDSMIRKIVSERFSEFKADMWARMDSTEYGRNHPAQFSCTTVELYSDSAITSTLLCIEHDNGLGVHGSAEFYSFNFDRRREKQIAFDEYFTEIKNGDSVWIMESIQYSTYYNYAWIDTLYDFDFNIQRDTISFNFDIYEIASYADGLIRTPIPRKRMSRLVQPEYK